MIKKLFMCFLIMLMICWGCIMYFLIYIDISLLIITILSLAAAIILFIGITYMTNNTFWWTLEDLEKYKNELKQKIDIYNNGIKVYQKLSNKKRLNKQ